MADVAPATPPSSPELLAEARALLAKKRPSSKEALAFINHYLTSRGWRVNNRSTAILESPSGTVRVRFLKINVETERKAQPDFPWTKTGSQSAIDMALAAAAKLPELKETAKAALTERLDERSERQTQAAAKREDEQRARYAFKLMENDPGTRAKLTKAMRLGWPLDKLAQDLGTEYSDVLDTLKRQKQPVPDRDTGLVTLEKPPIAPMLGGPAYRWIQNVAGGRVAVEVESLSDNGGTAGIYISASKSPMLSVHPKSLTMRMRLPFWDPNEIETERGDVIGYLERVKSGALLGVLSYIQAADKRKGSGRWLVSLFCRIMRGYGLTTFVALAPGDEGRPFMEALHQRGQIEIMERTPAVWHIKCSESPTKALFPAPPIPELPERGR